MFNAGKIDHKTWCDLTRDKLRERGFSKTHLETITSQIQPVAGLAETFQKLAEQAIPIYIVSGSIKYLIQRILGASQSLVEEIKCNDLIFDEEGLLKEIRGHDFDFEGKAKFIERIVDDRHCLPIEVLFVGNSLNDHWAIKSGARTLCVNPTHTDYTNSMIWSNYIKEMSSLTQILDNI
jgi:phosphoserine phosphatase